MNPGALLAKRYLVQDTIGSGEWGFVYRAFDMRFPEAQKLVVVKELIKHNPGVMPEEDLVKIFEREGNILASLNHSAIPAIFDFFAENNRVFMVLEYVEGKSLDSILNENRGSIQLKQILIWAIEICDALIYIHNHVTDLLLFSRMKPSNIIVGSSNRVVLTSIGIFEPLHKNPKGKSAVSQGKYLSEQQDSKALLAEEIYAFGMTLRYLLSGQVSQFEPSYTIDDRTAAKIKPAAPKELISIVEKMVTDQSVERFQSVEAVRKALLRFVAYHGRESEVVKKSAKAEPGIKQKTPAWSFTSGDEIRGTPGLFNGIMYVGSYDQYLYALSAADGSILWRFRTSGGIVGQPTMKDNIVYFGSEDRNLYALSSRTGRFIWKYDTNGPVRSSPRTAEGHVLIGSDSGDLHAVNLITAQTTWKTNLGSAIRSSPLIRSDGFYVGTEAGGVYCIDFGGNVKWKFHAKKAVTATPASWKDMILFPSLDASFYAVSRNNGWLQWSIRMGKGSVSSPFVVEDMVLFGSADGFVYAVDLVTLKTVWKYNTGAQISGSPVCIHGKVFIGNAAGKIVCLALQSGKLLWEYQTWHSITGAPIVNNDMIYFGSADNKVHALLLV